MSRPLVPDHRVAMALGVAFAAASVLMFHDAHEGRGRSRPWWVRLLPGG